MSCFLSYLSQNNKVVYTVYQHGIVEDKDVVPNKIFCTELYAFNVLEGKRFKDRIIMNSDCLYHTYDRKKPSFIKNGYEEKFTIGVIEQPYEEMEDILEVILNTLVKGKIYLMLHPRSQVAKYKKYEKYENLIILENEKIFDVNALVTINSTLALEYCAWGYEKPIFISWDRYFDEEYIKVYRGIRRYESKEDLAKQICEECGL